MRRTSSVDRVEDAAKVRTELNQAVHVAEVAIAQLSPEPGTSIARRDGRVVTSASNRRMYSNTPHPLYVILHRVVVVDHANDHPMHLLPH